MSVCGGVGVRVRGRGRLERKVRRLEDYSGR